MYRNKVYPKLKTRIVNLIDKENSTYPPKSSPVTKKNEIAPITLMTINIILKILKKSTIFLDFVSKNSVFFCWQIASPS